MLVTYGRTYFHIVSRDKTDMEVDKSYGNGDSTLAKQFSLYVLHRSRYYTFQNTEAHR